MTVDTPLDGAVAQTSCKGDERGVKAASPAGSGNDKKPVRVVHYTADSNGRPTVHHEAGRPTVHHEAQMTGLGSTWTMIARDSVPTWDLVESDDVEDILHVFWHNPPTVTKQVTPPDDAYPLPSEADPKFSPDQLWQGDAYPSLDALFDPEYDFSECYHVLYEACCSQMAERRCNCRQRR
ncbi:hypothetical protein CYLTODRAFT_447957 [Cylindrobasidium torrendii FP15055 ss-10]|uniref:Uncharacterized protein n=1 Tax=Cylindrobasidium torrendii FP15055 ss-10 TaxID=1314674 RepID=A0A0D7AR61_9AGAR|nr:hypothetical protein CYLTODRAFT_447957 [Cylindrobasidium torrendii FP15055 ss-10]